jgi:hypothetical protein
VLAPLALRTPLARCFFAYDCGVHGGSDDGSTMAGVIWVR